MIPMNISPLYLPQWVSKHDVADFFRNTFEESGVADNVAMFLNLANDPVVERLITPKVALTVAEYLAFEKYAHSGHPDGYDFFCRSDA